MTFRLLYVPDGPSLLTYEGTHTHAGPVIVGWDDLAPWRIGAELGRILGSLPIGSRGEAGALVSFLTGSWRAQDLRGQGAGT